MHFSCLFIFDQINIVFSNIPASLYTNIPIFQPGPKIFNTARSNFYVFNLSAPGDFAEKRVFERLVEWFSGHCCAKRAITYHKPVYRSYTSRPSDPDAKYQLAKFGHAQKATFRGLKHSRPQCLRVWECARKLWETLRRSSQNLAIWASQRMLFDPTQTFCFFYICFIAKCCVASVLERKKFS